MPALEPQVERREHEQRDDELDPEVVRVAGERVRPEHLLRPADRAEDVDPGLARRDRLDQDLVEVRAHLGEDELDDAVDRVERDPAAERSERVPVEALLRGASSATPVTRKPKWRTNFTIPFAHWASAWLVSRL